MPRTAGERVMANEEHVRILRSGVMAWNDWRKLNPRVVPSLRDAVLEGSDLVDVNLNRADLICANLNRAKLQHGNLKHASLNGAMLVDANLEYADLDDASLHGTALTHASLRDATLIRADLNSANLVEADLMYADLSNTNLTGTNLTITKLAHTILAATNMTNSFVGDTLFSGVSLVGVTGLSFVKHVAPSFVSVDTLEMTAADLGKDPSKQHEIEQFLEGVGVPKDYIGFFRSRIGKPIQFYSCFISYSTKDQEFADRLYADLRSRNIRCWLATEDLKIGDRFRMKIDEAIRVHDKLLIVLSETSVDSTWVENEVEAAFEKEKKRGEPVLFPIRLDDAMRETNQAWAATIRRTRHIGDFTKWKDHDEYQKALARLIRDLQADPRVSAASKI
jgi:hypothetical protein